MLQGSSKPYPEFDNLTPAQWLAKRLEKQSEYIVKNHNMKEIVEKMKKSIKEFEKQGSKGKKTVGKSSNKSNSDKDFNCGKCSEACEKNGALFSKCNDCDKRQHLKCSLVKRLDYNMYREGLRQITCFSCLIDPNKIET